MAVSGVDTGLVVGQFITGVVDGSDLDDEPDLIGARGTFEFTPAASYVPVPMANPNGFTLLRETFVAVLDSEGHLCTPDPDFPTKPGTRGIRLFATDSPNASVDNWTWHVTPKFVNASGMPIPSYIPPFDIYVLRDKVTDLATAIKVPNSTGIGKEQIVAYATSAQEAATYAARQAEYAAEEASSAGISAWEATEIAEQAMAVSALAEKVATGVQKQAADGEFIPDITVKVNTVANPADDVWMSDIIRESPLVSATLREVFPSSMRGATGTGWNTTLLTTTTDLNTVKTGGTYYTNYGSGDLSYSNAQTLNYPPLSSGAWGAGLGRGVLHVSTWGTGQAVQEYISVGSNTIPQSVYRRTGYANSWSKWYSYTAQRVDNTAGRAIYTWDDAANREQLIYGDTGWRSIPLENNYVGTLNIRRTNHIVSLRGQIKRPPGVSFNGTFLTAPTGFESDSPSWCYFPVKHNGNNTWFSILRKGTVELVFDGASGDGDGHETRFEISWATNRPWPTTLPGTPAANASATVPYN